jgi:GH43 family beta-xylosidase
MKKRIRRLSPVIVLIVLLMPIAVTNGQSNEGKPGILRNPLNPYAGADPWLVYYEGNYYLATTTWTSELTMRTSPTLAGLKAAMPVRIYFETDPSRCCNMWAPEFRLLEGPDGPRWYFYYTAGTSGTLDNQHTHVLESAGTDPMGPYTYKGRLYDPQNDTWAIDGSILQLGDSLYFLFSAWEGPQSLFIAPMSNPWTISGPRVLISQPEYSWEAYVNEGPVALYHEDDVFITYSASPCSGPDYKLGLLTYNGGDPLSADSWVKNPEPVFQRSDENGVFGPGHNGFFRSPDGTEDWIVYHANDSVSGGCDHGRTTRVQRFTWNADGTPNFGVPVSTTEEIIAPSGDVGVDPIPEFDPFSQFESYSRPGSYIRNVETFAQIGSGAVVDSRFYVMPGLADPDAASIVCINLPGYYLRHQGNAIYFHASDGSENFAGDATWWIRPGLADDTWISFESYNQPGMYIGRQFGTMALVALTEASPRTTLEDATFREEN